MDAKRTLKAKDIEQLENTSLASLLLGGVEVHTHEAGLEGASPACCVNCSQGTVCTFGVACCTGMTCEQCSAVSCVIGCTNVTCGQCTGVTCAGGCTAGTLNDLVER